MPPPPVPLLPLLEEELLLPEELLLLLDELLLDDEDELLDEELEELVPELPGLGFEYVYVYDPVYFDPLPVMITLAVVSLTI